MPDKRKLVGLVEQAYEGKLCLPNFQRDFVWPRDLVADLIRSVLRRYYIGSLLLLRCDPEHPPFAPAFLRGAKPDRLESRPELLVLDGQQRLTSLLYALTAPELSLKNSVQRRWFFVNLALLLTDPDNDEIVFDLAKNELDGLDDIKVQYRQRVLPCTTLMTSKAFMKWKNGLDDWLKDNEPENHVRYREEWRDHWTNAVNDFQNFTVPLVELPSVKDSDPESIGRVCYEKSPAMRELSWNIRAFIEVATPKGVTRFGRQCLPNSQQLTYIQRFDPPRYHHRAFGIVARAAVRIALL
jgi:hypothetical protein